MIKRIYIFIFITSWLTLALPLTSYADGGVFYRLNNQLHLFNQNKQTCFINFNNNIQNMILSINLNHSINNSDTVWIFPIPSNPTNIKINLLNAEPKFNVFYLQDYYLKNISDIFHAVAASQLMHIPIYYVIQQGSMTLSNGSSKPNTNAQYTVHNRIEKFGVVTELISTNNLNSLKAYFIDKKLNFPERFNKIMDKYFNAEYSFVVSYANKLNFFNDNIGVFISFPTSKIFFPLLLTSIYENLLFPIEIFIFGHYNPDIYSNLKQNYSVQHYFSFNYNVDDQLKEFFFNNDLIKYLKLTIIDINTEAKNFIDDIWIEPNEPYDLIFANLIINHKYVMFGIFFILISITSSVISGISILGYSKNNLLKLTILGISNIFSILAVSALSLLFFKPDSDKAINKKIIFSTTFIISMTLTILLFLIYRPLDIIYSDMGDAKLPLLLLLYITYKNYFYLTVFLTLFVFFSIFTYGILYNEKLLRYIVCFMFCIYSLSCFSGYIFFYCINNYNNIVQARSISYK